MMNRVVVRKFIPEDVPPIPFSSPSSRSPSVTPFEAPPPSTFRSSLPPIPYSSSQPHETPVIEVETSPKPEVEIGCDTKGIPTISHSIFSSCASC
ncbi:UNVERIFIED_CONTAM: hypothetical protein Slati_2955700 [Sesamum latifolium]|uniref:Uncharacterized protein n=1 Tax=Sesamum latifolium TaxID=2727402 RepID=A0AAW2VDK0_9LAMI